MFYNWISYYEQYAGSSHVLYRSWRQTAIIEVYDYTVDVELSRSENGALTSQKIHYAIDINILFNLDWKVKMMKGGHSLQWGILNVWQMPVPHLYEESGPPTLLVRWCAYTRREQMERAVHTSRFILHLDIEASVRLTKRIPHGCGLQSWDLLLS